MDSLLKTFSPSTQSFEETFKTAYSHGLEEIYTLENVDISKVKRIQVETPQAPKKRKTRPLPRQLTFDFGEALGPFYLDEPIQVLGLAKPLENYLDGLGKKVLRDLLKMDKLAEEVKRRLEVYMKERETSSVDFFSLIRSLVGSIDRKRARVFLEPFHLEEVYTLTPLETLEVKRLSSERKKEWAREVQIPKANEKLRKIINVYFKPWMQKRHGLSTRLEILERMEQISENPESSEGVLKFFDFYSFFFQADENLYASDLHALTRYQKVIEKALTYFPQPNRLLLSDLAHHLKSEFAINFTQISDPFIEKCLRHSSRFTVRKGSDGKIGVTLR